MSYSTIIIAIDAAIESGVSGPGKITSADGESVEYRSLADLLDARTYYQNLLNNANQTVGFKIQKVNGGDIRKYLLSQDL